MLRNMANYVALVHFWKLIYLCKRMKPCLTVAVFSKKKKLTCLIFESKELKLCLQSEEVYSFVLYTAGGGCKSMGLKKSTCLQRFCCVGCLPLSCPRRDPELPALTLQFLFLDFEPSSSSTQCPPLQTKSWLASEDWSVNTCGYKRPDLR